MDYTPNGTEWLMVMSTDFSQSAIAALCNPLQQLTRAYIVFLASQIQGTIRMNRRSFFTVTTGAFIGNAILAGGTAQEPETDSRLRFTSRRDNAAPFHL